MKGVTIGKLVKEPLTTSAFARFQEIVNQYWYPIGMVFPVLSYGDWIMHTLGCPVDKGRGMARIAVAAVTEGVPDLFIEPLGQFITSRKGMEQWLMQVRKYGEAEPRVTQYSSYEEMIENIKQELNTTEKLILRVRWFIGCQGFHPDGKP